MRLRRVVSAVDTGIAVNPDTIVAQLQGGLVFGLSAALWGEITIDKGRVQQSNFNDYRVLRIDEVPNIEVHVIPSGEDARRHRRDRHDRRPAGARQCDLRRDRRAPAPAADRSHRAGDEEADMRKKRSSTARRLGIVVAIVAVLGLGVLACYATRPDALAFAGGKAAALDSYEGHPTGVPADFTETDPIARGRYLAQAADCKSCHTTEGGKPFAGGLAFKLPFGTLYSPNITPDKETGIGAWTDADFLKAVHQGIDRDGERLYPAFPYAVLRVHDRRGRARDQGVSLHAAAGELHAAPEHALVSVQPALADGDLVGPVQAEPARSSRSPIAVPNGIAARISPKRSRIAAIAIRRAISCRRSTTRASSPAAKPKAGPRTTSPATRARASARGSADELASYLSTGHAKGRGTASGPMAEAVELSFAKMTPSDIRAMVAYVRSVPAIATPNLPAPKNEPAPADPKQGVAANVDERGKHVFAGACASCHDWTGISPLSPHATLTGARAVNDPSAKNVALIVHRRHQARHGRRAHDAGLRRCVQRR